MERKVKKGIKTEIITNELFDDVIGHSNSERKYFTIKNNDNIYKRFKSELNIKHLPYLGACVDFGLGDICLEEDNGIFKFYVIDRTSKFDYQEFDDIESAINHLVMFYEMVDEVDDSNKMKEILYQELHLKKKGMIEMKRKEEIEKLLVVVDMVNGFIKEGSMSDKDIARIIPRIDALVQKFISEEEGIAFIKDTHFEDSTEFKKFPPHCIKGTSESEVVDELKGYEEQSLSYEKNSTSTMYAPGFMNDIDSMKKLREVIITGCCTDICVLNLAIPLVNYFDQNNRDVNVCVVKNAVETYNAPYHNREEYNEMALKLMKQAGVNIREE